jgi:thiamine-monophosphate kinase
MEDIGEKKLLSEFILPMLSNTNVLVGPGDDAAVLSISNDNDAIGISTDRIGENLVALKLGLMNYCELGRYCALANISDIYAMGLKPTGFLINLGLPSKFLAKNAVEIIQGATDFCDSIGITIIGGDTKYTSSLSVVGVALGTGSRQNVMKRCGASVGDSVFVIGSVGLFAAALLYFAVAEPKGHRLRPRQRSFLQRVLCLPTLPLSNSEKLATIGCKSCMDVTDGLGYSLIALAESSGLSVEIDGSCIQMHPMVQTVADMLGLHAIDVTLSVGADFALVGAVRTTVAKDLITYIPGSQIVGRFTDNAHSTIIIDNCKLPLNSRPFEQFMSDIPDLLVHQFDDNTINNGITGD